MEKKFIRSGYSVPEIQECKSRALALDRTTILAEHRRTTDHIEDDNILTFVINHDPHMISQKHDGIQKKVFG